MKPGKWIIGMIVGIAMLQGGSAYAANEPVVKATNKADFAAVAAAVRKEVAPGGRWEFTNASEKAQIDRDLSDMQSLFDKYGSVDQMDSASKMQLFNDQEAVNEILTKRDGDHLVCKDEAPLGSLIPKRTCRTYAQIERDRADAQESARLREAIPRAMPTGH